MVKNWLKYGLISVLSALFLYAACGYNLATFCCGTCESNGIEALVKKPCHNSATTCCSSEHKEKPSSSCNTDEHKHKSCEIIHLKVDDSIISTEGQNFSPKHINCITLLANYFLVYYNKSTISSKTIHPPDHPLPLAGRTMLRSNCVLRL